ncbi:oxidoreductase FAD-binding domain protein [Sphingomonas sp. S17]|uniref:Hybrid-cluster NAD(P)-dependent oxidoreductase n=2 Tax=Bacteria TaxID=2 RepID=A0A411LEJ9_SPHPI|nr:MULTISPECIES: hybrid-cluster NAD(P)-dependent oxidoreductase [Sphingomonas]AHN97633.1 NADH oxidase [uncultured bacterium lac16]EGI55353.1 oxidoreductase FAD-binding domain protein [Sphingomonas sp. S17]MBQ1480452.1 hybrid-cluster NAD(P)-dependent oxidoreductase [Sphingomonas sp.]MCM3680679.1 hybrid-cluster NAD(P)-dependent oxidoreductase [Sphingomonas paucimobilis]MDG5971282.1 hybrid-cluster NAD(P)-dependent oxidoreductase [Sphingomonas paucimobilis]
MTMAPHRHLDELIPWTDRLHALEVVSVVDEAPAVKTFTFRPDGDCWFRYKPGQFVTLELPVEGAEPLFRTYTLSSTPSRPYSVAVTVKAQEGSIGTRWMFDHLRPGMRIKAYGPNGHFTHIGHPAGRYLFLSAGSGITPMMSMLRWMADLAPQSDVAFVTCARSPKDIIFRHELELLDRQMPNLSLSVMVKANSLGESWFGHRGQISHSMLATFVPDLMEREIFCCGPEPFMALVQDFLRDAGFDMAHYHQESFGEVPPDAPAEQVAVVTDAGEASDATVPVIFADSGVTGTCLPGQTVLEAARAAGVRIPAACESGICGTCKTMKVSGEVVMTHNGGILDDEVEEGYILACCSRPLGPVEVEA